MDDYRYDRLRTDWWKRRVVFGLTRNDLSMIAVILLLAGGAYASLDWDKIVTFW